MIKVEMKAPGKLVHVMIHGCMVLISFCLPNLKGTCMLRMCWSAIGLQVACVRAAWLQRPSREANDLVSSLCSHISGIVNYLTLFSD